jgi:hypothetical protein
METRAKRARIRRRKPRFAGKSIRSDFRAKPRIPRPKQPYLGSDVNVSDLLS